MSRRKILMRHQTVFYHVQHKYNVARRGEFDRWVWCDAPAAPFAEQSAAAGYARDLKEHYKLLPNKFVSAVRVIQRTSEITDREVQLSNAASNQKE